ncbi:MAG: response regulator transcription factor [Saprospiraceae bacterium]|nr:response regulator transcription factor [Saprospiraceae bacterium]
MKIALFDDHPIVLDGLKDFFSKKEGVEVVGTATRKADVISLLAAQEIDILVSDVITDEELGLELFEEIQRREFPTKVIVYSSLQGELVHNFLYEYGVVGIVNKSKGLEELWQLVEVAYLTTEYKKKSDGTPPPMLTAKEKDIVKYLARGLAAKEIAALTSTAVSTINNQKNHLLAKFECMNTTELVSKLTLMGYMKL